MSLLFNVSLSLSIDSYMLKASTVFLSLWGAKQAAKYKKKVKGGQNAKKEKKSRSLFHDFLCLVSNKWTEAFFPGHVKQGASWNSILFWSLQLERLI